MCVCVCVCVCDKFEKIGYGIILKLFFKVYFPSLHPVLVVSYFLHLKSKFFILGNSHMFLLQKFDSEC